MTNILKKSDIMNAIGMRGPAGKVIASIAMKKLKVDEINRHYNKCCDKEGHAFSEAILQSIGISYDIKPSQVDSIPAEGGFITISNHAFGGADGLILSSVVGSRRPDFKILTNFILSMIPTLKPCFLPVNPFESGVSSRKSFDGIKKALQHIDTGGGLGLFPAGEVSTYQKKGRRTAVGKCVVEDIPWPENMIKLIKRSGLPVIPIYFDGTNSDRFHRLGKIHPMLRTINLPKELFAKAGSTISVRIGKPITPSEIAEYNDIKELGGYLRSRVYALEADINNSNTSQQPVDGLVSLAEAIPSEVLEAELESIKERLLYSASSYRCYLASCDEIPNMMREIGRRREEAFRATGEGTNRPSDIDEFDNYYKHLILWDDAKKALAGAYRLGIGSEILKNHGGLGGFYARSLFNYGKGMEHLLGRSIELGRSFVSLDYQKENLPLMLLIKGLMYVVMKYADAEYFIGPVSISNAIPKFYQSLIVKFIDEKYSMHEYDGTVSSKTPFVPEYLRVEPDALIAKKIDSVEKFDRFLMRLSDNEVRIPTLVKKYIKINARIIKFNIDPLFNYSLDGLILLKFADFPKSELEMMTREMENGPERESIMNRFGYSLNDPA